MHAQCTTFCSLCSRGLNSIPLRAETSMVLTCVRIKKRMLVWTMLSAICMKSVNANDFGTELYLPGIVSSRSGVTPVVDLHDRHARDRAMHLHSRHGIGTRTSSHRHEAHSRPQTAHPSHQPPVGVHSAATSATLIGKEPLLRGSAPSPAYSSSYGGDGANGAPMEEDYFPPAFWDGPKKEGQVLEELGLCMHAKYSPGAGGYKWLDCPHDESCRSCISRSAHDMATSMIDYCVGNATTRAARHHLLESTLGPPASLSGPVIVLAVNQQYAALLVNWVCARRSQRSGDAIKDAVIVTQDPASYHLLLAAGFRSLLHPVLHWGERALHGRGHDVVQSMLFCTLHQLSSMGYDTILHDVDIVWRQDPRVALLGNPAWSKVDIIGAHAPRWDAHGPMNSGFVYFRSNKKVRSYLRTMVELTPIMFWIGSDQVIYNSLLRHWRFRQLHFHVVPRNAVVDLHTTDGKDGTIKMINDETSLLHVISDWVPHKINRLKLAKLWYVKDKCLRAATQRNTHQSLDTRTCPKVSDMCTDGV